MDETFTYQSTDNSGYKVGVKKGVYPAKKQNSRHKQPTYSTEGILGETVWCGQKWKQQTLKM